MALTNATVTFDIADMLGNDFDPRRTKMWTTTNIPGETIIDPAGDKIRLGSGNVTIGADGTGSFSTWVPAAGANPASWQTTVHVDYPDRNLPRGRAVKSFGPFTITGTANLADLVAEMPVQPEYLATVLETVQDMIDEATGGTGPALTAITDRLDGVNDHGNISGPLTLNPAKGFHVFDATGPTTITLGNPPGNSLAFKAITGADDVSVNGLPDLELTDNAWSTFVYYRGAWDLAASGAGGGGSVEPVTDPPTQPGAITVDPTSSGYNLSWVASTVAAGYEVQIDGGTWVDSGADTTHVFTGLTASSSHSGAVRAYNTLGTKSTTRTWGPATTDSVSFDEQIMAYNPLIYIHGGDGTIVDLSDDTSSPWVPTPGLVAPLADGPPLLPGDTASVHWQPDSQLIRSENGILAGMTSHTTICVVRSPNITTETYGSFLFSTGTNKMEWGAGWDFQSYSRYKVNEQHIVFSVWDGTTVKKFYDTDVNPTNQTDDYIPNPTVSTGGTAKLRMHGTEFGGSGTDGGFMARAILLPGVVLNHAQRVALCQAAGYPS